MYQLAFALLLAATTAAAYPPLTGKLAPPPEIAALTLPQGRLTVVGAGDKSAGFAALDQVRRLDDHRVRVIVLTVYDPGLPSRGSIAVQTVVAREFDCTAHTVREAGSQAFDEQGKLVIWLDPEEPRSVPPQTYMELLERLACDVSELDAPLEVNGSAEALRLGRELIHQARDGSNAAATSAH